MPRFPLPFQWGAVPSIVTAPPPAPPRWTAIHGAGHAWNVAQMGLLPRFEHIFPRVTSSQFRSVDFEFRVQTEYPLIIATDNAVVIESGITNP
jgi:hypothetical protein